jgi:nucleoside-diphosphate-sugar epimerase
MRVVITGAAGRIGNQLVDELSASHELLVMDRRPIIGRKSIIADLSQRPTTRGWRIWRDSKSSRWSDAFKGAHAVVHLAAAIEPSAPWEKVFPNNIQATWNVLEAAATHRVPRVVFASSNWVKAVENELAPSCYEPSGPKIDSETPPFSLTTYSLSKAFGELASRIFVDEGKLQAFVTVRNGSYGPSPSADDKTVRTRWIGVEGIRRLFRRCVEADLKGFHVVYGVSGQKQAPYDLSHTHEILSWFPRQASDRREVVKETA